MSFQSEPQPQPQPQPQPISGKLGDGADKLKKTGNKALKKARNLFGTILGKTTGSENNPTGMGEGMSTPAMRLRRTQSMGGKRRRKSRKRKGRRSKKRRTKRRRKSRRSKSRRRRRR